MYNQPASGLALYRLLFALILFPSAAVNAGPPSSVPYVPWVVNSPFEPEPWSYEECKSCHYDYENLPLNASNPDRHHLLIGTRIKTMDDWDLHGEWPYKTAPNHESDDDGFYDCLTCHVVSEGPLGFIDVSPVRDCFGCHEEDSVINNVPGNRHHATETAVSGECVVCHCVMPEPHIQIMQGGPQSPCAIYLSGQ